jgi:hypothetical protein
LPRTKVTKPCQFCHKAIDTRGIRMHQTVCSENPENTEDSKVVRIDSSHRRENIRVLMDYYREGLRDGFQFAAKRVAA